MTSYRNDVIRIYRKRIKRGSISKTEESLWDTALFSTHGGVLIGREGNPYLLRVYLLPEGIRQDTIGLYLHYFLRGDTDKNPHNHPWDYSESTILTGGYTEYVMERQWPPPLVQSFVKTTYEPGSTNHIHNTTYHRVELLDPKRGCWTLFRAGKRLCESNGTDWGFFDLKTKQHVPWGMYKE